MNLKSVAWFCAVSAVTLAGCAQTPLSVHIGSTRALVTSGETRIITERPRPSETTPILCSEPSPDIAKALSTLAKVSGGYGAANVGGGVSTAQSISILAGRTAGVVALRDGLFKACEAYANGVITSQSYALILSNYGDILVTLMLGEDAAGAGVGAASNPAPIPAPNLTIDMGGSGTPSKPAAAGTPVASNEARPAAAAPALASSATSFGADAVAPAKEKPAAGGARKDAEDPADSSEASGDASKDDAKGHGGGAPAAPATPSAVGAIAKTFFDSEPTRVFGSLIALCLTGKPVAARYETPSPYLDAVCTDLVGALRTAELAAAQKMIPPVPATPAH